MCWPRRRRVPTLWPCTTLISLSNLLSSKVEDSRVTRRKTKSCQVKNIWSIWGRVSTSWEYLKAWLRQVIVVRVGTHERKTILCWWRRCKTNAFGSWVLTIKAYRRSPSPHSSRLRTLRPSVPSNNLSIVHPRTSSAHASFSPRHHRKSLLIDMLSTSRLIKLASIVSSYALTLSSTQISSQICFMRLPWLKIQNFKQANQLVNSLASTSYRLARTTLRSLR